jgi:hypothetical protein
MPNTDLNESNLISNEFVVLNELALTILLMVFLSDIN